MPIRGVVLGVDVEKGNCHSVRGVEGTENFACETAGVRPALVDQDTSVLATSWKASLAGNSAGLSRATGLPPSPPRTDLQRDVTEQGNAKALGLTFATTFPKMW